MNRPRFMYALLALCCAVTPPLKAQGPFTFRHMMKKGETFRYLDVTNNKSTMEMGGQERTTTSTSRSVARYAVQDVRADGSMEVNTSMDSLVVKTQLPTGRDTTLLLPDMLNKRTQVTLTPLGKVVSRKTLDTVASLQRGMGMRGMRDPMRIHEFPATPVAVGGTWAIATVDTMEMMGGKTLMTYAYTYTLGGMENRGNVSCTKITYKGTLGIEGKGSMMGSETFIEGKGTVDGSFFFDPKEGRIVGDDFTLDTDITMAMTGANTMTIPMTQHTVASRSLITEKK